MRLWVFRIIVLVEVLAVSELMARIAVGNWPVLLPVKELGSRDAPHVQPRFKSHPFLPYAGRPGYGNKITWKPDYQAAPIVYDVKQNEYGFRGPSTPRRKPPGVYRILAFGASTTYGQCGENETWPAVLQSELRKSLHSDKIEVMNLAIDGANSAFTVVLAALVGLSFEPDMMIVYDGVNDRWAWRGSIEPDYSHILRHYDPSRIGFSDLLPKALFRSRLLRLLAARADKLLGRQASLNIYDHVYIPQRNMDIQTREGIPLLLRNLDSVRFIAQGNHIRFLTATFHFFDEHEKDFAEQVAAMREHFSGRHVPFVDLARTIPHLDKSIHTDYAHFSVEGNRRVAREFARYIVSHALIAKGRR